MINLSDKVILLAGVGGGIGNTFLHHLIDKAKYVFSASRSSEKEVLHGLEKFHSYTHYNLDLSNENKIQYLIKEIKKEVDSLDIFINTIGGSLYSHRLEEFPLSEFQEILNVNLVSAFLLTKAVIPLMKSKGGNILHIVSSSAKNLATPKAPYGIAKAGLAKFIQEAAAELAEYDIKINGISPTYVFTPRHEKEIKEKAQSTEKSKEEIIKHIRQSQLIKKSMYPQDLIPLLELLINTKVITGQIYNSTLGEVISY
jgi:NAD(P)-dependent dehydrogenase (short-subunit alcohol dehydrogenase family)